MNKIPFYPSELDAEITYFGMYEGDFINDDETIEFHFVDLIGEHIDGYSLFRLGRNGMTLCSSISNDPFDIDTNNDYTLKITGVDLV